MSRELWLLRHAKAESNDSIDDFDRTLKKRGKQAVKRMGAWMKELQLHPDLVISSPAIRAIATTRMLCPIIGVAEQDIQQDRRLYFADKDRLKSILADCPIKAQRVLLVGHNPGFEELLLDLTGNLPDQEKILPTCSLARLSMPESWQELASGSAQLIAITQAKSLANQD